MQLTNLQFGTSPVVVHAQGHHEYKPLWPPIRDAFFNARPRTLSPPAGLTIVTCNNGHAAMGLLERSLDHLGLPYIVAGRGIEEWKNARDKPRALIEALASIDTPLTMYADSRDAIVIDDPCVVGGRFAAFGCELLFSADRMNWPPLPEFQRYEDALAAGVKTDFRYLNGGMWIGRTGFCRRFFADVAAAPPVEEAPDSEQGLLKQLLPRYREEVRLDYRCEIFQNIGFVAKPILELR